MALERKTSALTSSPRLLDTKNVGLCVPDICRTSKLQTLVRAGTQKWLTNKQQMVNPIWLVGLHGIIPGFSCMNSGFTHPYPKALPITLTMAAFHFAVRAAWPHYSASRSAWLTVNVNRAIISDTRVPLCFDKSKRRLWRRSVCLHTSSECSKGRECSKGTVLATVVIDSLHKSRLDFYYGSAQCAKSTGTGDFIGKHQGYTVHMGRPRQQGAIPHQSPQKIAPSIGI